MRRLDLYILQPAEKRKSESSRDGENKTKKGLSHVSELDIDDAMRERRKRQARSWSRLNVSSVIAEILSKRNPDARCLCWKLIVCSKTKSTEDRIIRPLSNLSNKLYEAWDVASAHENTKDDGRQPVNGSSAVSDDAFLPNGHLWKGETAMVDFTEKKESDKLQKLLARCNMLQDMIDKKLSIYF
ncbi:hypothetical protein Syun_007734 [Stephania yunnanensis]|uniref:Uncharacterized protein n=1 Tax=Stephania yunnanensis TaxID=152371 RepID=A0AAP0PZ11_9MAGN